MEENEQKNKIYYLLDKVQVTEKNKDIVNKIKEELEKNNISLVAELLKHLKESAIETKEKSKDSNKKKTINKKEQDADINQQKDEDKKEQNTNSNQENKKEKKDNDNTEIYAKELIKEELERKFIGMLLNEPKAIAIYYFKYEECFFANDDLLNVYKMILFTDAEKYAPEVAKRSFNFAKATAETNELKRELKDQYKDEKSTKESIYIELKKLFAIRKGYLDIPVKTVQNEVINILNYELYNNMSVEEVEQAIEQITATEKFKRAILNENITEFLVKGNTTLTNGLELPFKILSSVFKGIRQGETTAFAMPSNSGKSRFTINIATYIALMHKKKVLIISNEMSEEKMKLCLITTIINNPEIQQLHGNKLHKTEGELLKFQFRPDDVKKVKVDENGFVLKEEKETQQEFAERLSKISTEYNMTIAVTDWFHKQVNNYMYFINITDHTNDELKKVIMNYYYKEKVEYVFYDTLKTDIENIGNGEEIKKTATILSNLAQNFKMYIGSTLQLAETNTDPVNLNINDLAVSRTVKEVLDTLCLFKQIHNEDLHKYEYSLKEVDTKFYDLEQFKDPDVRYYSCVVDKNRAGSKPKLVFRLNLAYNEWNELGFLRLK